jgi:DNA-binding LacI/PurR family transcriptional regulator
MARASGSDRSKGLNGSSRGVATAHDVARLAGVSQSAVSRAFTDGASISSETRQKVVAAAGQLNYRPNLIARSMITRRSHIIGVAMTYLENQFYPAVLEALSAAFEAIGYRVLLFTAKPGEPSDPILEEVLRYRVDALVLASISLSSRFDEECRNAGIPVILLNRKTKSTSVSSVTGDNRNGARAIAAFLVAGGHERFAYVAGLRNSSTSRDREMGFTKYLVAQGRQPPVCVTGHYDFDKAAKAARGLFAERDRPDAVFCANDHTAFAVMGVAQACGLRPGHDVSIVGFDDVRPASWPMVDLTTFVQPIGPMVERVVSIVQSQLAHPDDPARQEVIPGTLVVRGSARVPTSGVTGPAERRVWTPPALP